MAKIRIVFEFEVEDATGAVVADNKLLATIASETEADIQRRLIGEGFLHDDMALYAYNITSEVVD